MSSLYVDDQSASIRIRGNELLVTAGEQITEKMPLEWIGRIVICGNVQITTQAVVTLMKACIPVHFLSTRGNYRGCLQPALHKHAALRCMQYERYKSEDFRLEFSKTLLEAKLKNCRTLMLKHRRSHSGFECGMELEAISLETRKLAFCTGLDGLMGHEGVAAHWYFTAFARMVRREFRFEGRNRRPPKDPVNAMLSLGYTLLYNECMTAVESIGLDPNIGFLHAIEYGRSSMACDMVEEFRWLIDGMVLGLINRGMVHPHDFTVTEDKGCRMSDSARKCFYATYEERIRTEVDSQGTSVSYRRLLGRQSEHLARVVKGDEGRYQAYLHQ